ncbi:hypothetical protein JRQ81_001922 [Phrynocephalus forsythii]|uniref:E3 ubiquitin-protein ligase RNF25 n=1 Tax=Phrynocephalus forsythii TaxID=171643 RepID=A0A9Q0Y9V8_9SAUR|nr:hypothetical protein JRQ81_001922 [Phrynocephalus forsythii]
MEAAGGVEAPEGAEDWTLPSEVEVLESIYLDELQVCKGDGRSVPWEISITLHPATAEDQDAQYVCFTLVLSLPPQYPNEVPKISIRNPRGLSDEQIQKISQMLQGVAQAQLGTAMLYALIEKGKEILTENNIPHSQCVICLYGFQEKEAFTKTRCYHYFHSHCLASYVEHMEKDILAQREERAPPLTRLPQEEIEVQCPVCREPLAYDLTTLQEAPPPQQPMEVYQPDAQTLLHREQLRLIYQRQQEKGGIINPEEEKNRYFISLQKPAGTTECEHDAISEKVVDAEKDLTPPTSSENPQETTKATRKEPDKMERPSVAPHHHSKRERTRGEKPSLHGPGRQMHYKTLEMPGETHLLAVEGESRGFHRRPHRRKERGQRSGGSHGQEFPKSCHRESSSSLTDRREQCVRDLSSVKEGIHSAEEKNTEGHRMPMQTIQGREDDTLEVSHCELKEPPKWKGQRETQDYRWQEKTRSRGYGSYAKVPRGRGWYRPNTRREPQGQETGEVSRR